MDIGTLSRRPSRVKRPRPRPDRTLALSPVTLDCPDCRHRTRADYKNFRTVATLDGVVRLALTIRRCHDPDCPRFLRPYRPEAESRHAQHRSVPEIHGELTRRGVALAPRSVANLLDRYDELRALATADPARLGPLLRRQGRVVLAIDGLQPDVGHEV